MPGLPLDWPACLPGCELTSLSWLSSIQQPRLVRRPGPWSASVNICVRKCQRALHPRKPPPPPPAWALPTVGAIGPHACLSVVGSICVSHTHTPRTPLPSDTLARAPLAHCCTRTHSAVLGGSGPHRQSTTWRLGNTPALLSPLRRGPDRCRSRASLAVRPWPCRCALPCKTDRAREACVNLIWVCVDSCYYDLRASAPLR